MNRFNLGKHSLVISTTSLEAQRWFDLGLNWCFGFNKNEGIKCFRKALEFDPDCVMAHWGIAFGSGPFYNLTWREHGKDEANAATKTGFEHIANQLGIGKERRPAAQLQRRADGILAALLAVLALSRFGCGHATVIGKGTGSPPQYRLKADATGPGAVGARPLRLGCREVWCGVIWRSSVRATSSPRCRGDVSGSTTTLEPRLMRP